MVNVSSGLELIGIGKKIGMMKTLKTSLLTN